MKPVVEGHRVKEGPLSNLNYNNYNSSTLTFATTVFSRAKGVNWLPMLISSGWIEDTGEGEPM